MPDIDNIHVQSCGIQLLRCCDCSCCRRCGFMWNVFGWRIWTIELKNMSHHLLSRVSYLLRRQESKWFMRCWWWRRGERFFSVFLQRRFDVWTVCSCATVGTRWFPFSSHFALRQRWMCTFFFTQFHSIRMDSHCNRLVVLSLMVFDFGLVLKRRHFPKIKICVPRQPRRATNTEIRYRRWQRTMQTRQLTRTFLWRQCLFVRFAILFSYEWLCDINISMWWHGMTSD